MPRVRRLQSGGLLESDLLAAAVDLHGVAKDTDYPEIVKSLHGIQSISVNQAIFVMKGLELSI